MGVSTTGESGETFLTRILTLEIYWGSSPVKIRFRPEIDPLTSDVLFFCTQIWPLPENSGPNQQTFQFLVGGTLDHNFQDTSGTCLVSPVALKPRIRRCAALCKEKKLTIRLSEFRMDYPTQIVEKNNS